MDKNTMNKNITDNNVINNNVMDNNVMNNNVVDNNVVDKNVMNKNIMDKNIMDKIILQGLKFYGYHGCKPDEKTLGQWFEIDAEFYGDFSKAGSSDRLEDTLNYSVAYKMIKNIVEGPSVNLIEHLCQKIINDLLTLPLVKKVWVRVKKPQAPLKGPLNYAGVEMVRWKNEK
jgi:dihydroneopterin aldolase